AIGPVADIDIDVVSLGMVDQSLLREMHEVSNVALQAMKGSDEYDFNANLRLVLWNQPDFMWLR
uniref:Laccase-C1 (Fragments) n=1 Tax=Cerrena unicolor TaxID=90312 RepID=LACC1_CERUI|nr:RecName: Full=Laccase-C1; AltName: Full=Benzenediol:oxygen oxidoreductase C1; AltName: Full=Diphenol oxidase C1; AltName: Full=Lac C1; AltName: Full=Urishiol oxidase C1 [Cerrena unicolor]